MAINFKEIEFKYPADEIKLQTFLDLVRPLEVKEWITVGSYDDYFVNKEDGFIRYRWTDNRGELTIKKKTIDKNNNERIEVNLMTEPNALHKVTAFAEGLGYAHNFSIFKTCHIANLEKVVLVYYVVYDKELKEKRRFIEIEANEHYPWESEAQALDTVVNFEKLMEPLGLTHKNRMKKSLYELFKQ